MFRLLDLAIVKLDTYVEENYIYNVIQVITIKNCTSYGNTKYYKTTICVSVGKWGHAPTCCKRDLVPPLRLTLMVVLYYYCIDSYDLYYIIYIVFFDRCIQPDDGQVK